MLNWLRRLLRKWLVRSSGPITLSEIGIQVMLTDKVILPSVSEEIGRLMGESLVGHPYDECEKRGCDKLNAADN
ncbi:hypothetical protein LCGC14_2085840 [marine sediment metagenome]|uniref:Uncharacterized protein n=1 Tax=marine sediment metagenome TaxID=412755 RepID=A0A0F9GSK0_9ZZZZ